MNAVLRGLLLHPAECILEGQVHGFVFVLVDSLIPSCRQIILYPFRVHIAEGTQERFAGRGRVTPRLSCRRLN